MSLLKVDTNKCNKCSICRATCPKGLIFLQDYETKEEVFPYIYNEEACINCGHCITACPQGAISLETMNMNDCPLIDDKLIPSLEQVDQLIKARRSIRNFQEKEVDKSTLEKLIHVSRYAPTAMNLQGVYWKVFAKEKTHKLKKHVMDWMNSLIESKNEMAINYQFDKMVQTCESGEDVILRDAPNVVLAYHHEKDTTGPGACRIAMTTFELAAFAHGLGACWAGFLDIAILAWPNVRKELELPEGFVPECSMMIGFPKYAYKRIPERKEPSIDWA